MATTRKQLYDGETPFQPFVEANNIPCGAVSTSYSVEETIAYIYRRVQELQQVASGGAEISGALKVKVDYANHSTSHLDDPDSITWVPEMSIPTALAPYAWKRTRYTWTVDGETSDLKTTYEIVATALYPETQVMYCAVGIGVASGSLRGPREYNTSGVGSEDAGVKGVTWFYYFPGIDGSSTQGYMAVRHREAGQDFPIIAENSTWRVKLMAQYPITSPGSGGSGES